MQIVDQLDLTVHSSDLYTDNSKFGGFKLPFGRWTMDQESIGYFLSPFPLPMSVAATRHGALPEIFNIHERIL